ncbi:MAG: serine/threonine protein kinase [Planctomycetales bacterium]|nr:serine/threonine protein kinase [Planctomycetales bacterium]
MASRHLDEESIFHTARKIAHPVAQAEYLERICAGDQSLYERVKSLLEVEQQETNFLKSHNVSQFTSNESLVAEQPGQQIGRYKLLQKIGEGGFGVVYMADQQRPVRRKVALKIIKPGMDTQSVIARFEAERQALAMMDDPNIARVLDGGETESGRPYFVMELVKGLPITEYCDKNELSTTERLALFKVVCDAVQHAHQKGIIHRDLKPSNVLVTLADGRPIVKVIDFGVAKAINQQLTEKTLFTAFGQMVGTPRYMSPEQAEMSCLDVDTRSDVYSLGVLLYELLTGTTPLEAERLRTAGYAEMQKLIREVDPPKPSTRLSTSGEKLTAIAKHRSVSPDKLKSLVQGDLDWIVMKALEKDRNRRYESPSRLARDISNYLQSEPVDARPPTLRYRTAKYMRRHRVALAVGCVLIGSLSISLVASVYSAHVARRHLAELEAQKQQLLEDALSQTTLFVLQGDLSRARNKLEAAQQLGADAGRCELLAGLIKLQEGTYKEARLLLQKAQKRLPHSTVAKSLSLICDDFAGFEHQYLLDVGTLKDWPANTFEELLFRGLAQTRANPQLAVIDLEKARDKNAGNAAIHLLLGSALRLLAAETPNPQLAYGFANEAAEETLVATKLLPENSLAFAEYIHSRIVLANLCEKLGPQYDDQRRQYIDETRLAVEQSRTMPKYGLMAHKARMFFYNQFGTRDDEVAETFDNGPLDPRQSEEYSDVIFRRCWLKFVASDYDAAREQSNFLQGKFAHRTNLTFPVVIDMTTATESDLETLQQKYASQLSKPGRDDQGIFAHHDWALARLLKLDAVAKQRSERFRELCDTIPLDIAASHKPIADYMCGRLDLTAAESQIKSATHSNRVLAEAYFAFAIGRLADGDRKEARRLFEACLSTDYYEYFVYWWSIAFLERLEDKTWLPWLTSELTKSTT